MIDPNMGELVRRWGGKKRAVKQQLGKQTHRSGELRERCFSKQPQFYMIESKVLFEVHAVRRILE